MSRARPRWRLNTPVSRYGLTAMQLWQSWPVDVDAPLWVRTRCKDCGEEVGRVVEIESQLLYRGIGAHLADDEYAACWLLLDEPKGGTPRAWCPRCSLPLCLDRRELHQAARTARANRRHKSLYLGASSPSDA